MLRHMPSQALDSYAPYCGKGGSTPSDLHKTLFIKPWLEIHTLQNMSAE